jgi:muramoyltetrapeptide carboxypeptidase
MLFPKPLFPGARVALIAPASPIPAERLESAIQSVRDLGLDPVVFDSCTAVHGYFSGTDELRAHDVNRAFSDDTIDGILCMRGGYGVIRLMERIDFTMIRQHPKFFSGYSDITTLHIALNQLCGFVTYHVPMPGTELYAGVDAYTRDLLEKMMFGRSIGVIENPPGLKTGILVPGTARGELTGGNLSLVASSLGTPFEIDTRGKILFLEDIDEEPYRIDRMLMQLILAGKIKDCSGLLLGYWTRISAAKPEESLSLEQVFQEIIVPQKRPTLINFACGHELPTASLPLGQTAELDVTAHTLKFVKT